MIIFDFSEWIEIWSIFILFLTKVNCFILSDSRKIIFQITIFDICWPSLRQTIISGVLDHCKWECEYCQSTCIHATLFLLSYISAVISSLSAFNLLPFNNSINFLKSEVVERATGLCLSNKISPCDICLYVSTAKRISCSFYLAMTKINFN